MDIAHAANADLDQLCELYVATGNSPKDVIGEEGEPMFDVNATGDDDDDLDAPEY